MADSDQAMEQPLAFTVYEHLSTEELAELNQWLDHVEAMNDEIEEDTRCSHEYLKQH